MGGEKSTKARALIVAVWGLLWLIGLLPIANTHVKAQHSPEINFDKVTFLSTWTKSGRVQLNKGEYREPAAPGSASEIVVKLTDKIAVGKINGKDVAAVILVTDPGGSGTFYDLALLVKGPQEWVNTNVAYLGDRVKIHSIALENNEIAVDLTAHGPDDPMCCPNQQTIERFVVDDNRLIKTTDRIHEKADQPLVGTLWKWQQTLYNNDTKTIPPDPNHYTLKLQPDKTLNIRADCNRGGGIYTINGSEISLEITHTTMAMCPPGSLEDKYLQDLNAAAIYFIKGDHLYIDLKYDTGTMKFAR